MKPLFSSLKSGLMSLGLVAGLTVPSLAGPILQPDLLIPTSSAAPGITPVRDEWAGGNDRQMYEDWRWRNRGGDGRWRSGNFRERNFSRNWNGGNGNWDGGNNNWRWRHHRHHRDFDGGDAAILGLGLGLGLGSLAYNPYYYDPYPRYYQPRRIYRTERLSSAHVRWCYNRYRSYRAWDNTFQPYYGPRRQCLSPYNT
jgi:hypothetical protein